MNNLMPDGDSSPDGGLFNRQADYWHVQVVPPSMLLACVGYAHSGRVMPAAIRAVGL